MNTYGNQLEIYIYIHIHRFIYTYVYTYIYKYVYINQWTTNGHHCQPIEQPMGFNSITMEQCNNNGTHMGICGHQQNQ